MIKQATIALVGCGVMIAATTLYIELTVRQVVALSTPSVLPSSPLATGDTSKAIDTPLATLSIDFSPYLFGAPRSPASEEVKETRINAVLKGVFMNPDKEDRAALLKVEGTDHYLRVGDSLKDNADVVLSDVNKGVSNIVCRW